jgi:hypothetical protein
MVASYDEYMNKGLFSSFFFTVILTPNAIGLLDHAYV